MAKAIYQFALFVACVVVAQPAIAHPHIFAKYEVDLAQKDDATYALHFTFRVHNVITPNPLLRDQQFVTSNTLEAIDQHPFYLFLDIDGHPLGRQNVELTRVDGTDDNPIYTFDMEIPASAGDFGFSIYDPEYYDAVSLAAPDGLRVKVTKLNCWALDEEVGKTMWGIISTTHVECGDVNHPLPHVRQSKKLPFGEQNTEQLPP